MVITREQLRKKAYLLGGICCAAIVMVVLLVVLVHGHSGGAKNINGNKICQTSACYSAASELEADMNTDVDPCQDFYQYVCGGYVARYKAETKPRRRLSAPTLIVQERIQGLLDAESYSGATPPMISDAIRFLSQCHDFSQMTPENRIRKMMQHYKDTMGSELGSWPIGSKNWNDGEFDLQRALTYLRSSFWMGAVYDIGALISESNKRKYEIQIRLNLLIPPQLVNSTDAKTERELESVLNRVIDEPIRILAELYSSDSESTQKMWKDILDLRTFAVELSRIQGGPAGNDSETYTLSELEKISNEVDWTTYLKQAFGSDAFSETDKIHVTRALLEKTSQLLKRTSKRTVANYVIYRPLLQYFATMEKECVQETVHVFVHAIGAAYVDKYLNDGTIHAIEEQLNEVRLAFMKLLNTTKWMDKSTRQRAENKLKLIKAHIALPQLYRDKERLTKFYTELRVTPGYGGNDYLKSLDSVFGFQKSVERMSWNMKNVPFVFMQGTLITNAMYVPLDNSMGILAGILLEPFYHSERPIAMNYGSLGYVLGHELTHGFDNNGRNYDEYGRKVNWWSDYATKEYQKRYKCYVKSYEQFAADDQNATAYAMQTAGENIADGGGIRESYEAFKSLMARNENARQRLPEAMSKYTPEQLFFISFGNSYCTHMDKETEQYLRQSDVHSLDFDRVTGTTMNSIGFSQAFNCPKSSRMNPVKKCSLFE